MVRGRDPKNETHRLSWIRVRVDSSLPRALGFRHWAERAPGCLHSAQLVSAPTYP